MTVAFSATDASGRRAIGSRGIGLQVLQGPAGDHAAGLHQHQVVGEPLHLGDVMADVEDRDRERGMQRLEVGQDLVLAQAVEPGERLVHQQKPGLREQGAPDGDPLALAARKAERRPIEKALHPQQRDDLVEARRLLGPAPQGTAVAIEKVAPDREMREQARLLEHVADRPLIGRPESRAVLPDLAADREIAVPQHLQPGDAAQHRRLAAARRPEERGHAAHRRLERGIEHEGAERAPKARDDRGGGLGAHAPSRPTRFPITAIERMTQKEKTSMPADRMCASVQRSVST